MNPLLKAIGKLIQLFILLYFVVLFYDEHLRMAHDVINTTNISFMLGVLSIFVFIDFVHIVKNDLE